MLSTGVPYNVTTLEQLTADIATLNAILDNACVTPTPPLLGFELTWNDIANSPFVTHTDLNTFINGNGGAANYTSVVTVGNVQTFYGGTAVDLGDNFMDGNASIVSIRDEAFQVVAQGTRGQSSCDARTLIALPALVVQTSDCQSSNAVLTSLNLQALTTQTSGNQSSNAAILAISLPSLTTQTDSNQSNNTLLTAITLPLLTTQVGAKEAGNQNSNPALLSLLLPSLTTQATENQRSNAVLPTISLPALTTQINDNQTNNTLLTTITTPALTSIGTGNYTGCNYAIMTINVDASLFGAPDILLAAAGGATII